MRLFLIGHDNSGSQAMVKSLLSAFPDATFELAVTTGLYYRKTLLQSIVKMLRESSFVFCASRAVEMFLHRIKGESLGTIASAAGIAWFETSDINGTDALARIRTFAPDIIVSLYSMHIYRAEILSIPRLAAISAHPSVLPNYRGLEVFFWAMANGEDQIGVSVFKLTPGSISAWSPMKSCCAVETRQHAPGLSHHHGGRREPLDQDHSRDRGRHRKIPRAGGVPPVGSPREMRMRRFWRAGHSLF